MMERVEVGTISKVEFVLDRDLPFKYCPNPKCVVFQCDVNTRVTRCRLCGSEMQLTDRTASVPFARYAP